MKLPRIYSHFSPGQVFTIEEAGLKLGTRGNTLRKRLSDLGMRGYISPIRQGLYRLSRLNHTLDNEVSYTSLEIVSKLTPNCYIGYQTALLFHVYQNIPLNSVGYIISQTKFNNFQFELRDYMWCQSSESYGIESHHIYTEHYNFTIHVTNIEKTLLDCLKRPAYCNNLQTLISLCNKLSKPPNFDLLIYYAKKMQIRSVYNRLGYLLDYKKVEWEVPISVLATLEEHMSQKQIDWHIKTSSVNINKWKINFHSLNYDSN